MFNDPFAGQRGKFEACVTCRFFFATPKTHDTGSGPGECARFPNVVVKNSLDYCGEFKQDDLKAAHIKALDAKKQEK
jgi:hypothetical protein